MREVGVDAARRPRAASSTEPGDATVAVGLGQKMRFGLAMTGAPRRRPAWPPSAPRPVAELTRCRPSRSFSAAAACAWTQRVEGCGPGSHILPRRDLPIALLQARQHAAQTLDSELGGLHGRVRGVCVGRLQRIERLGAFGLGGFLSRSDGGLGLDD